MGNLGIEYQAEMGYELRTLLFPCTNLISRLYDELLVWIDVLTTASLGRLLHQHHYWTLRFIFQIAGKMLFLQTHKGHWVNKTLTITGNVSCFQLPYEKEMVTLLSIGISYLFKATVHSGRRKPPKTQKKTLGENQWQLFGALFFLNNNATHLMCEKSCFVCKKRLLILPFFFPS